MHVNLSPLGASISMLQDAISTQSFTIESHKINGFTHSCNGILNEPIGAIQQSAIQLKRNLTFRSCTPHPAHWAARVYISVEVGAARGDTMCLLPVPFHVVYWCTKLFMINDLGILNYSPNCTVRHLYRSLTQSPLSASVRPNDFSLPHVWCVCVCVCNFEYARRPMMANGMRGCSSNYDLCVFVCEDEQNANDSVANMQLPDALILHLSFPINWSKYS